MKSVFTPSLHGLVAFGIATLFPFASYAQVPTSATADLVLGQVDFTSAIRPATASAQSFNDPVSISIDPASGKVFVADGLNHRVLRFASRASLVNGSPAEMVIGQADFAGKSPNRGGIPAANSLSSPRGVFVDAGGRLWVADSANSRVLMFENAATLGLNSTADLVLGQSAFDLNGESDAADRMAVPEGVWVDSNGSLWVGEFRNHRVTRFDNAALKNIGDPADGVLGQPGFDSSVNGSGAAQLFNPYGVSVDSTGTLWVADRENNRVVGYPGASLLPPGSPATRLIGQSAFGNTSESSASNALSGPRSVQVDASGALWVLDAGNNRALRFDSIALKLNGASADAAIGQPSLTSNLPGLTSQNLNLEATAFLFVDTDLRPWIADVTNNRVVRFGVSTPAVPTIDTTPPTLTVRGRKTIETLRKRVVFRGTASDDSSGIDRIEVKTKRGTKVRKIKSGTKWKVVLKVTKTSGRVIVKFRAIDGAGNRSKFSKVRILRR